jgi:hypothetical protein
VVAAAGAHCAGTSPAAVAAGVAGATLAVPLLMSTNLTAVLLASVVPSATTIATVPLNVVPTAGVTPSGTTDALGQPDSEFCSVPFSLLLTGFVLCSRANV